MTGFPGAMSVLRMAVVCISLIMAGCGAKTSTTQGGATAAVTIDPGLLLKDIIYDTTLRPVARALGGWQWSSFITSFGTLLTSFKYPLEMQKVTYQSIGADGQPHTMTGLLILPKAASGAKPAVPILLYQHGTETYRPYSPSQFLTHMDRPGDYPEVMVAAAIASTGYAVAMADYEGLGDNTGTQPYVHGTTLAQQVIDMLRASRTVIGGSSACTWNSQLFLMGYSEGGYVTMTTTRELQLKHAAEFTVTASAPLSGPHDLSGEMRTLMLSDTPSKAPYFLPFLLSGYHYASGEALFSLAAAMLPPYASTIPPLFSGSSPSDRISEAMGMVFSPPVTLIAAKNVLTVPFFATLSDAASPEVAFIRQNDSYRHPQNVNSAWLPTVPMRMYHHRSDELVPYANSQVAFDAFSTVGGKNHSLRGPGVELVEERVSLSISPSDPVKTVHLGAAFPELSNGWRWLDGFKK